MNADQFRTLLAEMTRCRDAEDFRGALAYADLALDVAPLNTYAWICKGEILPHCQPERFGISESDLQEWSARCYMEALRDRPKNAAILYNLSVIYSKLDRFEQQASMLQNIFDAHQEHALEPQISSQELRTMLDHARLRAGVDIGLQRVREMAVTIAQDGSPTAPPQGNTASTEVDPIIYDVAKEVFGDEPLILDWTGNSLSGLMMDLFEMARLGLREEMFAAVNEARTLYGETDVVKNHLHLLSLDDSTNDSPSIRHDSPTEMQEARIDTTSDIIFHWARRAIAMEDYSTAGRLLTSLTSEEKNDTEVCFLRGSLAASQKRWSEAVTLFENLVVLNPLNANVWSQLVRCHLAQGDLPTALRVSERALQSLPTPDRGLCLLSAQIETMLNPSKALGTLYRVSRQFPGPDVELLRVQCLLAVGRQSEAKKLMASIQPESLDASLSDTYSHLSSICLRESS